MGAYVYGCVWMCVHVCVCVGGGGLVPKCWCDHLGLDHVVKGAWVHVHMCVGTLTLKCGRDRVEQGAWAGRGGCFWGQGLGSGFGVLVLPSGRVWGACH